MCEHDPNKVEKERAKEMIEFDRQRKIERAKANIAAEIGNMPDEDRKEVLDQVLANVGSTLRVSEERS